MKKIFQILIIISVLITFQACEQDLDPKLYGTITTTNFFKTSQDLDAATTAIYHEMRLGGWAPYLFSDGSSFAMDEVATGEWTTRWSWVNFLNGNWNVGDQMTKGFYNWISPVVTRCTYTLAKMEEAPVEDDVKKNYLAQVRALRVFFVYDIYRLYGPMPLLTEADKALNPDPDYKPARPSAQEVEAFIASELRAAADDLPVEQAEYGRVTKGAALHYLLKYYMHLKQWQNAVQTANEIIGLGYYELESNYADIFSAQNEGNRELIFVVVGEPLANFGNHTYVNLLPGDFKSPHGNSVDGWNGHRMPWTFYDTFDASDKRRELAIVEYQTKSGSKVNLRTSGDIGALPLKYGIDPQALGIWAGNDKVLDRYAEVLLFKAEALNELNGPNQESIDLINQIRARAFAGAVEENEKVLVNEEFDGNFNNNLIGAFSINNYQTDVADISFNKDITGVLSQANSLHLNLKNSGSEWWAIQVRADGIPVEEGKVYTVSFKAKASKDVTFDFKSEGPLSHSQPVSLKANQVTDIAFDLNAAGSDGNSVMFLALGNTGNDYDIWIDSIMIKKKAQSGGGTGSYLLTLAQFSSTQDLRDWILKERGWEFWYEGKRREDLIRMGKYLEVGKQNASDFSEKNLLFPIPTSVMIENPNLIQNPGY